MEETVWHRETRKPSMMYGRLGFREGASQVVIPDHLHLHLVVPKLRLCKCCDGYMYIISHARSVQVAAAS